MNRDVFQKAFDSLSFSPDFQERTISLLHQSFGESQKKEKYNMKHKKMRRVVVAAALIAVFGISAGAISSQLKPAEIARLFDRIEAGDLFEKAEKTLTEESLPLGEYAVTLLGTVTGEEIKTDWSDAGLSLSSGKTYAVLAVQRKDGAPVGLEEFVENHVVTPLISGYESDWTWDDERERADFDRIPANGTTLDGRSTCTVIDDVLYCLFESNNLELFADHEVSLAVYYARDSEGTYLFPSHDIFIMGEDGAVSFREDFTAPHAMFTLLLDERKADPEAARKLLEEHIQSLQGESEK